MVKFSNLVAEVKIYCKIYRKKKHLPERQLDQQWMVPVARRRNQTNRFLTFIESNRTKMGMGPGKIYSMNSSF